MWFVPIYFRVLQKVFSIRDIRIRASIVWKLCETHRHVFTFFSLFTWFEKVWNVITFFHFWYKLKLQIWCVLCSIPFVLYRSCQLYFLSVVVIKTTITFTKQQKQIHLSSKLYPHLMKTIILIVLTISL